LTSSTKARSRSCPRIKNIICTARAQLAQSGLLRILEADELLDSLGDIREAFIGEEVFNSLTVLIDKEFAEVP
jgi:hypothetical protein